MNKWIAITIFAVGLSLPSPGRADEPTGKLYDAGLTFKNEANKATPLSSWAGKKVVMSMIYASCHGACPLIIKHLKAVQTALDKKKIVASFVLITFDPKNDTPEKLGHYRELMEINRPNWFLLSGTENATRKLSMILGIKYSKNKKTGEVMHDNRIVLLNEKGQLVRNLDGLDSSLDELF